MKMLFIFYTIAILFYWSVESRQCYNCECDYDWATSTGSCSSPDFLSNCPLQENGNQYCTVTSLYVGNSEARFFLPVAPDFYQDSHFFEALEVISLSNTTWLPTTDISISYGCDWDGCNHPSVAEYLPESFQMNINQTILNSALLDGQSSSLTCDLCSACINNIIAILCQQQPCNNGMCYIDEIHSYVANASNNCTYYFTSYCQTLANPQPPMVRIRAIYYIDLPAEKQLEIDEVDIRCTKDFCNTIEVLEYLKGQIQTTVNVHPYFQFSTTTEATTPNEAATMIVKRSNIFLYFLLVLLLV